MLQEKAQVLSVIALDLEGTLISNAMSQLPRPGLYGFLEGCRSICNRVVMFTTANEVTFRQIAALLVAEGKAPSWFMTIEYINWNGKTKDLTVIPDFDASSAVLVDDFYLYVHPGQEAQWIQIGQFESPYSNDDTELERVLVKLKQR